MSIRNLTAITGLPFSVPSIEDVTEKLPRRGTWEAYSKAVITHGKYYYKNGLVLDYWDESKGPLYYPAGFRPEATKEELDTIIIHHTASNAPLANQANYHVNTHKWPGIAYHVVVDEGKIKQTNDLHSMTFHTGGWNTNTIAVCINADLSKRELTSRERELLYAAILSVKAAVPTIQYIKGHNEYNETACPCTSMDQIRSDIAALETQMKAKDDITVLRQKMYRATEQHKYLYNQYAADPANNKWLEDYLVRMYDVTRDMGMFFGSEK